MPRAIVDGQSLLDAVAAGSSAGGIDFGDGSLGNVTLSTLMESSGRRNYANLTIDSSGTLAVLALRKLTVLCTGNLEIQGSSALHADGRGCPGTAGAAGGGGATGGPSAAGSSAADVGTNDTLLCVTQGGTGGGGGTGANPSGAGGDGGDTVRRFKDIEDTPNGPAGGVGAGAGAAGTGGTGTSAVVIGAAARTRIIDELGGQSFPGLMGGGGAGGGGGSGGSGSSGPIGTGGSGGGAGLQSGANLGHGLDGSPGNTGPNLGGTPGGAAGSGGGGAGGGALEVRVQGDVTLAASARISANGGNGGNGAQAAALFELPGSSGAAGGAGGGGYVLLIYGGVGTNVDAAHITADAGNPGTAGPVRLGITTIAGGLGGAAGAAEDGYVAIVVV